MWSAALTAPQIIVAEGPAVVRPQHEDGRLGEGRGIKRIEDLAEVRVREARRGPV